jgi:integrase
VTIRGAGRRLMHRTSTVQVKFAYTRSYRDRHGKLRIEYRRAGKTITLRGSPGTLEFQQSYDGARAIFEGQAASGKVTRGTLRWLCCEYYKSAEFHQLAPNTQRARRLVFEGILNEAISPNTALLFADCPVGKFGHQHVRVLRDRKKEYPEAANIRLKALRGLFNWATDNGTVGVKLNPARDVPRLKVREDGYHSWTEQERSKFEERHAIGSKARLAYALLFHTGQRRSDVVRFGRHVHAGKLRFTQQKNRRRKPITLELPILAQLQQVIDASPVGDLTFLVSDHGKPFTEAGFGNWFREKCNEAGLRQCTAHGLRKAAATVAAENGATAHELMAIFGWLSLKEAERYTRGAERKKLAERGMGLLLPLKPRTESV